MLIILVAVFILIFSYFYLYKPYQYWKNLNVPCIDSYLGIMNFMRFLFQLETLTENFQRLYDFKDIRAIGFYNLNKPSLLIKDLNLIKQIGIKDFDHFTDHNQLINEDFDDIFGKNLFSLRGEKWKRMRATLSPAFTSSKMRQMFVLISECANKLVKYFDEIVDPEKPYDIELNDMLTRFANDVIATTAFGIECDSLREKNNEFYLMGKDATNFGGIRSLKFIGYQCCMPLMKLLNIQIFSSEVTNFFRNIIKTTITTREQQNIIRPDMIHLLMEARKGKLKHEEAKDEDAGFATVDESNVGKETETIKHELTDDDITSQALLFFIAGFGTIANAMCHMGYELAQHEDIQKRLQNEIDDVLKEKNGQISYESVLKMKYLDMVFSETIRKWPGAPFLDRQCTIPYKIKADGPNNPEIPIEKGVVVMIPVYSIQRDPKYYENPEKFDPERFNDENKKNIDPMSYIPFGVGPRNCIGSRFAILEAKTVFVHLLSKFSFVLTKKSQIPLKLEKGQFVLTAEKGFWVGLKKRNDK